MGVMARRLRIQAEGAIYHVMNRGNYRRDLFETVGAAKAFEEVLGEVCVRFGWRLHAYVILRDHYHLALTTPQANLVNGMHWLQSTFATRFNRFRSEKGHLFQGRYQALLVEDAGALARLVNFIHLNPVRARLVEAVQIAAFRWSSLGRFTRGELLPQLSSEPWLEAAGWKPQGRDDWPAYTQALVRLAGDAVEQQRQGFGTMSVGWAIGSKAWCNRLARGQTHLLFSTRLPGAALEAIRENLWLEIVRNEMTRLGKTHDDLLADKKSAGWKLAIAEHLRGTTMVPYRWIAKELNMGSPASLRVFMCRHRALAGRLPSQPVPFGPAV